MHRYYDEEERDDELYHHGRKGQKWGQHIYAMAKATAKKAARSASKNLKAGGKFLKENPEFAYGVAVPALSYIGSKVLQKRKLKKNLKIIDGIEQRYKNGDIYAI